MSEKVKYQQEYILRSSVGVLYSCLSTPSGLSDWLSDNVNIKDDVYTFIWDGTEESAKLLSKKTNESIRFQWLEDEGTNCFWEFRIRVDGITKENALLITDFSDEDELEESILLWDSQVDSLRGVVGG